MNAYCTECGKKMKEGYSCPRCRKSYCTNDAESKNNCCPECSNRMKKENW